MSKSAKKTVIKRDDWYSNLTEADKAIWKLIFYHPTSIMSRTAALDLLFCVIGTGLEWKNGEITDTLEDNYLSAIKPRCRSFDKEMYNKAWTNTFYEKVFYTDRLNRESVDRLRAYEFYENCVTEHTRNNIKKLVTTAVVPNSFYPIGMYSNLMVIPKDIKPDWLDLAIETCDLIMATDPMHRCYNDRLQNKDNIRNAKKQKVKLLKYKSKLAKERCV